MKPASILTIAGVALLATALRFRPAWGHAFPASTRPAVGATISSSPRAVSITFDAPIEKLFAKLQVLDGASQDETTGSPAISADKRELSVPVKPLSPGTYTVRWSVVAEDGHRTEGSYTFTLTPTR